MSNVIKVNFEGKIPALDGLRAISIIAVIGFHAGWPGFAGGGRGVDLFFVISGFLITWLLVKEKEKYGAVSLRKFYCRRLLRIFPAFYAFLFGYWILCQLIFTDFKPNVLKSLLVAGTYTTDFMMGCFDHDVLVAHTWSLSLEEQFYFLFPAIIAFMNKKNALLIVIASLVFVFVWRLELYSALGDSAPTYRYAYSPDTRFDTILMGCLVALLMSFPRSNLYLRKAFSDSKMLYLGWILAIVSIAISSLSKAFMSTVGYSLTAVACSIILMFSLFPTNNIFTKILSLGPMQIIGRLSYSMYLWHTVALGLAGRASHHFNPAIDGLVKTSAYVIFTFALAFASYLIIEKRFPNLKKRFSVVQAGNTL